jgi:predicted DNA-binding protein with PD1-like motif
MKNMPQANGLTSFDPALPRSRTLAHPGPFNPVRIQAKQSRSATHIRLALAPNLDLFTAIVRPLNAMGIHSASITLLGGSLKTAHYCVAPPDPSGNAVIAYTPAIAAGSACLIFGNATVGKNSKGTPIVHCHAVVQTESGAIRGGHLFTEKCIVGYAPLYALVTSIDDFELIVTPDLETNISLIQPQEKHDA